MHLQVTTYEFCELSFLPHFFAFVVGFVVYAYLSSIEDRQPYNDPSRLVVADFRIVF